jgi:hypothetical protein
MTFIHVTMKEHSFVDLETKEGRVALQTNVKGRMRLKLAGPILLVLLAACGGRDDLSARPTAHQPASTQVQRTVEPFSERDTNSNRLIQSSELAIASILASEPLQSNSSRRYVMQIPRSAYGFGTSDSIFTDKDMINCWIFEWGSLVRKCTFLEYGETSWADIRSGKPFNAAYITFTLVPNADDPAKARVLAVETYVNPPDEHYWVMNISNVSGTWRKDSLTRHPLPFPSTW